MPSSKIDNSESIEKENKNITWFLVRILKNKNKRNILFFSF